MEYNLIVIREQLVDSFNSSELQELCFNLNVDYEIINGENKLDKARELLTYLNRRNRMAELVVYCQQERPQIKWDVIKTTQSLNDDFAQNIELTPTIAAKYYETKFELYRSVWQALYTLKEAGTQLWELASKENIAHFANCLQEAQRLVGVNEILFDKADHEALLAVMQEFSQFRAGKVTLYNIRSAQDEQYIMASDIHYQIERNKQSKDRYEALLQSVSDKFRTQLNAWAVH